MQLGLAPGSILRTLTIPRSLKIRFQISKDGIRITGSNSRGSRISENSINQNVNSGILLEKARGVTLEGNTVNLNRIVGIYLSEFKRKQPDK